MAGPLGRHTLQYQQPLYTPAAPLHKGLLAWWKVLPLRVRMLRWEDLTGRYPATVTITSDANGVHPTTRPGGWGDVRATGSLDIATPATSAFSFTQGGTDQPVTFMGWFYLSSLAGNPSLFWRNNEYRVQLTSTNLNFYVYSSGGTTIYLGRQAPGGTALYQDQWVHLTATYDGSHTAAGCALYRNGVQVDTTNWVAGTYTGMVGAAASTYFASASTGTARTDDIRIYTRVLAPDAIRAAYQASRLGWPAGLSRTLWPGAALVPKVIDPDAIPWDIVVLWSGTAATIPAGWVRETALDGRYPRGAPAATAGGGTGGSATHSHTTTGHVHTTAHEHTIPNSGAAAGASSRDVGSTNPSDTHTHTGNPNTPDPTTTLATDSPSTNAVNHEPAYVETLFLRSLGVTHGFPANTIGLWADSAAAPTNWALCDGTAGRPDYRGVFPKGAAAATDPGATGGGATTHTHSVASHAHGFTYSHSHPGIASAIRAQALVAGDQSGATAGVATATHTHALTFGNATPGITSSSDPTSSASIPEPPYWVLAYVQNISGALQQTGEIIALWLGAEADIPTDWALCDGTDGTPDLRSLFLKGASTLAGIGGSGGSSASHGHTATGHSHPVNTHSHSVTAATGAGENRTAGTIANAATTAHTHTWTAATTADFTSGSTTPTLQSVADMLPPYVNVLFVQWQKPAGGLGITAETGTLTLTGTSTPLRTTVGAGSAAVALTGTAVTLGVALPATVGSLTLSGTATPLRAVRRLAAASGTLTSTGTASPLVVTVAASPGALTLTGTATVLGLTLAAGSGALTSTGTDATLVYTSLKTLQADAGMLTLTGSDVTLVHGIVRRLLADPGAVMLSGTGTPLCWRRKLPAAATALTLSGTATPLRATRQLVVSSSAATVAGTATPLRLTLPAASSGVTSTGTATPLQLTLAAASGSATLTGTAATLTHRTTLAFSQGRAVFVNKLTGVVEGATHALDTPNLLVQVYDATTPWAVQFSAAVAIEPTVFDVTVTFAQAQSGYLLLATGPAPSYGAALSGSTVTTVLGTAHALNTPNLLVQVYDGTGLQMPALIEVHQTTYDVRVTLAQAQSGRVVIGSAVPPGSLANGVKTLSGGTSTSYPASEHGRSTPNLLVQAYDGGTPMRQVQGQVTVAPSNYDVSVVFAQNQSGRVLVGGGGAAGPRIMPADAGALTSTSTATTLRLTLPVVAGAGALSGTSVILAVSLPALTSPLTCTSTPAVLAGTMLAGSGVLTSTGTATPLRTARRLTADAGTLMGTGTSASLRAARRVVAVSGTLTLTSTAAPLQHLVRLLAAAGSLLSTGQDVGLLYGSQKVLSADAATLTLTGTATPVGTARRLTAAVGSLTSTGQAVLPQVTMATVSGALMAVGTSATLRRTHRLDAFSGALTLAGQAVTLQSTLAAASASLSLSGTASMLRVSMPAAASAGTLTGTSAALVYGARKVLLADVDTLTLTGTSVILRRPVRMGADSGSLSLTGTAAILRGSRTMAAFTVGLSVTSTATSLRLLLAATSSPLPLTGTSTPLRLVVSAGAGSVTVTGMSAALLYGSQQVLLAESGSLTLTGTGTPLRSLRRMVAASTTSSLVGTATPLRVTVLVSSGSLTLTGTATPVRQSHRLVAQAGMLTLTGQDAVLRYGSRTILLAEAGALTLTGSAVAVRVTLPAAVTGLTLSRPDALLRWTQQAVAASGSLAIEGIPVSLVLSLPAEAGQLILSGEASLTLVMPASAGALTLAGTEIRFDYSAIPPIMRPAPIPGGGLVSSNGTVGTLRSGGGVALGLRPHAKPEPVGVEE